MSGPAPAPDFQESWNFRDTHKKLERVLDEFSWCLGMGMSSLCLWGVIASVYRFPDRYFRCIQTTEIHGITHVDGVRGCSRASGYPSCWDPGLDKSEPSTAQLLLLQILEHFEASTSSGM